MLPILSYHSNFDEMILQGTKMWKINGEISINFVSARYNTLDKNKL